MFGSALLRNRGALNFHYKHALIILNLKWCITTLPFQWLKHFVNRLDCNVVNTIRHHFLCDAQEDIQHRAVTVTYICHPLALAD